ncbi:tripartite tricarboxylate transporter substrate-binding protein [Haloparvum sp. AD34]
MSDHNSISSRRRFVQTVGASALVGIAGCSSSEGSSNGGGSTSTSSGGSDDGWTPERNLSVIVPWGAGGGTDTMTRGVMKPAEDILAERGVNVSINVENVTGAGGLNGARRVLSKPADGYTIFASTNAITPNVALDKADFTLDDWAGIARVQHDTSWIYSSGRDGVGHKSVDSLLEKAKNEGIQLGAVGGLLGGAFTIQFAKAAGIWENTQIVTYNDAGRMRTDVISGEIDGAFGEIQEMKSAYQDGEVSLLVVGTEDPVEDFPDVTAAGERGWDATFGTMRGFNAKAGTPTEALDYWSQLVEEAMQTDSYQQLAEETMVDLRPGYLGRQEWMNQMEENLEFYNKMEKLYNEKTS